MADNQLQSLSGLECLTELQYVDFSINEITIITSDDFKNNKKILDLNLSGNPIESFEGLRHLVMVESINLSSNENIKDMSLFPEIANLSKLTAEY
mmetsp:Transcript_10658/g.11985  ORF Transcript_10658/g.11985 Transcript_10658/m.11985 type:complete len:95 (-) Transcript_10658:158-442(-)